MGIPYKAGGQGTAWTPWHYPQSRPILMVMKVQWLDFTLRSQWANTGAIWTITGATWQWKTAREFYYSIWWQWIATTVSFLPAFNFFGLTPLSQGGEGSNEIYITIDWPKWLLPRSILSCDKRWTWAKKWTATITLSTLVVWPCKYSWVLYSMYRTACFFFLLCYFMEKKAN